jgi:hypothetical protein
VTECLLSDPETHISCDDRRGVPARLDTLGLTLPITPCFTTRGARVVVARLGTTRQAFTYRHLLPGGGFVVLGRGDVAWVEASLPVRALGDNQEALLLPEALEAARELVREVEDLCEPNPTCGGHRFELYKVARVDLVRDFDGVTSLGYLLDGLHGLPAPGWARKRRETFPGHWGGNSLRVGTRGWGATLYDKHAESEGRAPAGRVRFEAMLRSRPLGGQWAAAHGGPIRVVGDVEEAQLQAMRRAMFERVGFGREVKSMNGVEKAILEAPGLSGAERRQLFVYLTAPELAATLSSGSELKYRRLAQELGIAPGCVEDRPRESGGVRLDYGAGLEVENAA